MKLTRMEQRAKGWCESVAEAGKVYFAVEWKGESAVILNYAKEKMVSAGGGGYDKESQAINDVLRFLPGCEDMNKGGCGQGAIIGYLSERGWFLEEIYQGSSYNVFLLKKEGYKEY